ncbi:hypothetical protein [Paenibacillus sp. 1P07SE]|uniref:hypothetical protein n=1 Tax=Paenibacillus sp. 1P07SE TaxID=3132209 RepID=UPI0039A6B9BF
MGRKRILDNVEIDSKYLDTKNWPEVLTENFSEEGKALYLKRKIAVEMYVSDHPLSEIIEVSGLDQKEIHRFVKRCFMQDENGYIWGYRALIPHKKLTTYTRKKLPSLDDQKSGIKLTGIFQLLLRTYPSIRETIIDYYFKKKKKKVSEPAILIQHLHPKFLKSCRAVGISELEYPFNTQDLGRRSLYRYIKKLEKEYPIEAAKRTGDKAVRQLKHSGTGEKNEISITHPFDRVEFDAHAIDVIIAIRFKNIDGDEYVEIMDRIWLLSIIDVATRVSLGHHLCLKPQYSVMDVLECIRNAIVPWAPKKLTIPGLNYPENGGHHSTAIPETEWAVWNEFCFDNFQAHMAEIVRERLKGFVGCAVNAGPISTPERRPFIERFFGLLANNGYKRLVNTTGSNPNDIKRKQPEKAAIQYEITADEIEQLTEVLIANYNNEPHSGLSYLSPLEVMKQRIIMRDMMPRTMTEDKRNEDYFLCYTIKRVIQGNEKEGKRPYINFEGAQYKSEVLSRSFKLIGQEIHLVVNIKDLRVLKAYFKDGSEFGYLTASGKWGISPHTLQMRKQINKLIRRKALYLSETDDPVESLHHHLEQRAKKNKKSRNELAHVRKYSNQNKSNSETHNTAANKVSPQKTLKKVGSPNTNKGSDELEKLRQRFKTITF